MFEFHLALFLLSALKCLLDVLMQKLSDENLEYVKKERINPTSANFLFFERIKNRDFVVLFLDF